MQDFKFQSYVEFYESLTDEEKVMVSILKELIQDTLPNIKEKLSWNVPFFIIITAFAISGRDLYPGERKQNLVWNLVSQRVT